MLLAFSCFAQDDAVNVTSPNGQIEFRLFNAIPVDSPLQLHRLAYQVRIHGKLLLDTSFLGLDIHSQQPLLGEKVGLIGTKKDGNSVIAEFMQNGSLGRLINVEIRAYDDKIEFRYVVPESLQLEELLIENEYTEFHFAQDIPPHTSLALPCVVEQPGLARVTISEIRGKEYSPMSLEQEDSRTLLTKLARTKNVPPLAVEGKTPMASPWRVLKIDAQ